MGDGCTQEGEWGCREMGSGRYPWLLGYRVDIDVVFSNGVWQTFKVRMREREIEKSGSYRCYRSSLTWSHLSYVIWRVSVEKAEHHFNTIDFDFTKHSTKSSNAYLGKLQVPLVHILQQSLPFQSSSGRLPWGSASSFTACLWSAPGRVFCVSASTSLA